MRCLFLVCFLVPAAGARADDPKDKAGAMAPIKVVALDRKEPVEYFRDVDPILVKKCAFCHSGNVKESKFDLSTYETLMKGGKRGRSVVPGKSAESLLVRMSGRTEKPIMPPKTEEPLTPGELATLKLWIDQGAKAPTGQKERTRVIVGLPPASVHPIHAIAVSPDKSAVVAGRGNQLHVFDAGSGNLIRSLLDPGLKTPDGKPAKAAHLSLIESLAFSPDGRYLASGSYQEVNLWDAKTGLLVRKLPGFADRVVAVAFSPDGKWLATGGGAPTEDGEVKVFEVASCKLIADVKNSHSDQVFGVCFSPDSSKLASCGADKFVKVFEIPSGKLIKAFEGHTHHVLDVGWKPDGKFLASGGADNVVKIWDYEKGEQARTIQAHQKQITRLVFIGTTSQFATCSGDQTIRFWNADNGGNVRNFSGNNDFVYALSVSPDGTLVAAGGEEGIVRLYNGANGQLTKSLVIPAN